ncbi:aminotransferase class I/II-fold pyridoxal phosphate-dependent enzyme [Sunxiuqinia elliptica]|uniref:Aspartate/methionine/tyrosine aminotransferase n=1 Tax=Sunxiuqinia elliptica TaxID=655355 RepID=A0A1I2FVN7_9BACT|nr:aminotransferase class I/II-fold pyridoxal phosphate-dependent enzyme [Sunxiuqinia elliptica]TDO05326.1 aspartate/methionine/tyrosine aminotransferase [Sunxiuqinia elliptica]TDO64875.1 aspartate/methionine/tyrosine aminotransferase [Sunxiuqinia elliptica]SFF08817.1 Aspartate/methionine/tyrosine aminotransferase [Sunxiuqinia elliptica]
MNPQAEELNKIIQAKNPVIYDLLSAKGKNIFFPKKGILGQTADAKGTRINATIGAAVEDNGSPMRLESIESNIKLDPSLVFPYAPSFGRPDIRAKWQSMIFEKNPSLQGKTLSLPVVTNALTHGVSMAGYLFVDEGDQVIVPDLFWGNYNLILTHAYGAQLSKFNLFKDGGFDLEAFRAKLAEGGIGKKILILNFPNNPTGYTPTQAEIKAIVGIIKESAEAGNKIVVFSDDAYFGLVYEEGIEPESIFAPLSDLHENVLALKIDGPTKEDYVWGFRVGFMTYGVKGGDAELYGALEAKTGGAVRGNISNAANVSQSLLLSAFENEAYHAQKEAKFEIMNTRYQAVKEVLKDDKYQQYFTALPYNSGYFMCVQLAEGLDGEQVRQILIEKYSIGLINLNNVLRVAFSAVAASDVKELFEGIYNACKDAAQ